MVVSLVERGVDLEEMVGVGGGVELFGHVGRLLQRYHHLLYQWCFLCHTFRSFLDCFSSPLSHPLRLKLRFFFFSCRCCCFFLSRMFFPRNFCLGGEQLEIMRNKINVGRTGGFITSLVDLVLNL